jgi:lactate dehydrogenase-like 2-hydroxyacid dehydrogenase
MENENVEEMRALNNNTVASLVMALVLSHLHRLIDVL